jgi:hypothetical protein
MIPLLRHVLASLLLLAGVAPAAATDDTRAALEQRATVRRAELGGAYTVIVEPPFLVVGDEPPAVVRERCRATIRWAVARLKAAYFARDPGQIIEIWLFRDRGSYERELRERFGETAISPYGFYSPRHHALFMNISTGNGTLVHEIVHPFIRTNFPACPPWFNEGLASLYEQCTDEDGQIVGRVNWRLPGLQERIRAGSVPAFRDLMALSAAEFYGEAEGYSVHYGQARYLCFYLQERGLLRTYYQEFVATAQADPTGYATLQRVLGVADMAAFQKDWEAFVLRRRFPE